MINWDSVKTAEEKSAEAEAALIATLTAAVQVYMDDKAKAYGYDDIKSAVTYAEEPRVAKFQLEGQAFRAWRSAVWDYCYTQMDAVMAGTRAAPTAEQLIAELPAFVAPE